MIAFLFRDQAWGQAHARAQLFVSEEMKLKKLPETGKSRTCHPTVTPQALPELTPPHYTTGQQRGAQPGKGLC